MKTIKENINSKEFKKLMIYTRGREEPRLNELKILKIKDVNQGR